MITSRNKTFGFWLLAGSILFFAFLNICCVLQFEYDIIVIKFSAEGRNSLKSWFVLHGFAILFFGILLSANCALIYIENDTSIRTVTFKNIITRQQTSYFFEELDGYITTKIAHVNLHTYYDTICLIRNGCVLKKIDSFYYSNYNELKIGLLNIPNLGHQKFGLVKSIKVFFNQPIVRN